MESKKGYKGCSTDMKHRFTNGKKKCRVPRGVIGERGRMKSEVGINRNTLMYHKGFINDDTRDSTMNATQYSSIT